jgi:hypothetical protein
MARNQRKYSKATKKGENTMMPLTAGAEIDELRRVLRESEQRRQAAEIKLADRERQLGTAYQTIDAQEHQIDLLTAELVPLRQAAALNNYAVDFPRIFNRTRAS